jgi:hypothetical protein
LPYLSEFSHRRILLLLAVVLTGAALIRIVVYTWWRCAYTERDRDILALGAMSALGFLALGFFYYIQPGYGLALLIPIYLLGAAGLTTILAFCVRLVEAATNRVARREAKFKPVGSGIVLPIALALFTPTLASAIDKNLTNLLPTASLGIEESYRFVGRHWHVGDVLLNANPSAYLNTPKGSTLLYFCERSCGLGLMHTERGWVDRMLGAPVVASVDELKHVLDSNDVVWWIAMDRELYSERYSTETRALLLRRMKVVYRSETTSVYRQDRQNLAAPDRTLVRP